MADTTDACVCVTADTTAPGAVPELDVPELLVPVGVAPVGAAVRAGVGVAVGVAVAVDLGDAVNMKILRYEAV